MDRREAVKALMGLPALASVSVANVGPNDVIVAELDSFVPVAHAEQMYAELQEIWPRNKVIICEPGARLKVIRQGS